jgi:hypothetical protein
MNDNGTQLKPDITVKKRTINIEAKEEYINGRLTSFTIEKVNGFPNHVILAQRMLTCALSSIQDYFEKAVGEGRMESSGMVKERNIIRPQFIGALNS